MLVTAIIALSAVIAVLWLICRGGDSKAHRAAVKEHVLCEAQNPVTQNRVTEKPGLGCDRRESSMTVRDLEAEARAESVLREVRAGK